MSKTRNLKSVIWKEGDHYVAQCLDVDVSSFGKNRAEALKNLEEALELYFEDNPQSKKIQVKYPKITNVRIENA